MGRLKREKVKAKKFLDKKQKVATKKKSGTPHASRRIGLKRHGE